MALEWRSVSSSNIAEIGYDFETAELQIRFNRGDVYSYQGVPADVYEEFMTAGSQGQFFAWNIKNVYPYNRV